MRSFGLLAALLLLPASALSASRVAVVDPIDSDAVLSEAVIRLRAELTSAGFEVVRLLGQEKGDTRAELERELVPAPAATLALVRVSEAAAIDVWVVDRVSGKTSVRRIEAVASSEMVPAALAIRAVDLLRASLLETTLPGRVSPEKVPADLAALLPRPRENRWPAGAAFGFGIGVLHSFVGLDPALTPVLRVGVGVYERLALRMELVGPGFSASAQSSEGGAAVRQELAALGLLFALQRGPVAPYLGVAIGVFHLRARGNPNPPSIGKSGEAWAFLGAASGGVALHLGSNSSLLAELETIATFPGVTVDVGGVVSGRAGRPSFLASLGPSWTF